MPFSTTLFNHSVSSTAADVLGNAREFIRNKLYFTSLSQTPHQYPNVHFFTIDNALVYINFYSDFGPNNLAHVIRFCEIMQEKFKNPLLASKRICLYSSMDSDKRANAAFLMCAYMMIVQKKTPDEAYQPLVGISQPFLPYRDAGYGAATYHITILDCLRGVYKALQLGLLDLENIDPDEYEFYERVENGDFNWITDKFIAMASPKDDPPGAPATSYGQSMHSPAYTTQTTNASNRKSGTVATTFSTASGVMSRNVVTPSTTTQTQISGPVFVNGKKQFNPAYRIDDLINHLKERGTSTVVRLNNKIYDRKRFLDGGVDHVELYFPDGSTPPDGILKRFLELCETKPGVIAVHCKAGLGRTGTLIGAYLMKHYKFTAAEVIGLLRVLRPGSVVGPQQNYLQSMQAKLWKMQPLAKLPPNIAMLKAPTFPTSRRFPLTDVHDIYTSSSSTPSSPPKPISRTTTPRSQTPIKKSYDHLSSDAEMADASDDVDDLVVQNLNLDPRVDYQQQRPATSANMYATPAGGYYQSLLETGRVSDYDPMDYEASGKLVDGDLPAQPRKHAGSGSAVSSTATASNAAQIRRDLLASAMSGVPGQAQKSQKQPQQQQQQHESWKQQQRPTSANPATHASGGGQQRPTSASYYLTSSNPPTSSINAANAASNQSRYNLRSSGIPATPTGLITNSGRNLDFSASNMERGNRLMGYTSSDISSFVLTGTGKPMTPAVPGTPGVAGTTTPVDSYGAQGVKRVGGPREQAFSSGTTRR